MKTFLTALALLLAGLSTIGCVLTPEEVSKLDCRQIAQGIAQARGYLAQHPPHPAHDPYGYNAAINNSARNIHAQNEVLLTMEYQRRCIY